MNKFLLFLLLAGLIWLPSTLKAQVIFTAAIDSAQEVPSPVGAVPGKGTGSFSLNDARTELSYSITVTGLSGSISAAHFHNGPAGTAAGVVRTITMTGNIATGVWKSTDSQPLTATLLNELFKGRMYVNFHTATNPGGEIRGQVLLSTGLGFTAQIDSAQEVPSPVGAVPGKGTGSFSLNAARTELTYNVTVNALSGNLTAGHFHNAPAGTAGNVVRAITFVGNTASGVWKNTDTQALTDSMVSELLKGRIYVNSHTAANPGGEIRGQLGFGAGIITSVEVISDGIPASFALYQNYPNPFNPSTKVGFRIAFGGFVSLKVYDVLGREVATLVNEELKPGSYQATFVANRFSSGVYFYQIQVGHGSQSSTRGFTKAQKMLLIK